MRPIVDEERPRFLTDEGFNMDITRGLRRHYPEIDLLTAQDAGLLHAPDPQVLEETQRLGRILLSHDTHTMPGHFASLLARLPPDQHLPGLLLIAQEAPIGPAIEWIAEVWGASRHDEWRDTMNYLPM